MKLKENKEKKMPHPGIEPEFNKNSVCMERNSSTPIPLGHIAVDIKSVITCTVQVNRTSGCVKTMMRNFVKLQKYAFLKQIQIETSTKMYTPFFYRNKLTIWTICAFRVLNPRQ